ncbi:S24 family peptidase [Ampullimonas aquatilis]|uniref:S24 family peptidase n=1 Tax=Ampullimonas aquatilis TaxID=1341549 RepID=UPI003C72CFB6
MNKRDKTATSPIAQALSALMRRDDISSANQLAELTNVPQPTISRILNGTTKDPEGTTVTALADHFKVSDSQMRGIEPLDDETSNLITTNKYVNFGLLDVHASAGNGRKTHEFPDVVKRISVLEDWANSTLGGDLSRIRVISAHGTSMQGTIENGDVLFVDSTIQHYDGDGIYIIARDGDLQVKRLQKMHGNILALLSDNKAYEPERLTEDQANEIRICGRVLAAWSIKKFW